MLNKNHLIILIILTGMQLSGCAILDANHKHNRPVSKSYPTHPNFQTDLSQYKSIQSSSARPWQRSDMSVAVAISGGGYRAANLGAGILMEMEAYKHRKLKNNLLQEIDYFSTVSGGGYAAGYYLYKMHRYFKENPNAGLSQFNFTTEFLTDVVNSRFESDQNKFEILNTDQDQNLKLHKSVGSVDKYTALISELIKKPLKKRTKEQHANLSISYEDLLMSDVLKSLFVARVYRGENFEVQLENNLFNYKYDRDIFRLGDIFVEKDDKTKSVKLPYWITNSTIFQNGALFPFSPDILKKYKIFKYRYRGETKAAANAFNSPYYGYDFPVITGVRASSNAPILFPPSVFVSSDCPNLCYLQLLDGGLSDNLGIDTAVSLLSQETTPIKILIVIDAYNEPTTPYSHSGRQPNPLEMVTKLVDNDADARRNRIHSRRLPEIEYLLCRNKTENVLLVYLDLDSVPEAKEIRTGLSVDIEQQRKILNIAHQIFDKSVFDDFFNNPAKYKC